MASFPFIENPFGSTSPSFSSSGGNSPSVPIRAPGGTFYTSNHSGFGDWVLQRFGQNDSLNWSTYIGGSSSDFGYALAIQDSVLAIQGVGGSSNFPIVKTLSDSGDVAPVDGSDIQLMKINIKKGQILWSAYHASPDNYITRKITLDRYYNLFVPGTTYGSGGIRPVGTAGYYQQNGYVGNEGFLLGFTNENKRRWTTHFGSLSPSPVSNMDIVQGISVTKDDRLFICGQTRVKNNTMPLVNWNGVCYFDWLVADTADGASDGLIAMFHIEDLTTLGIEKYNNVVKKGGFILYPNPNEGKFNIKLEKTPNQNLNVSVMNVMGQVVYEKQSIIPEMNELNIDPGSLSKGVYLINIKDKDSDVTLKFVVE